MRYLGNKEVIAPEIYKLLESKGLINNDLVFFDAFCGSGSVANYLKVFYDSIVINDNLKWSVVYTAGRICSSNCTFDLLKLDPFEYLNRNPNVIKGFFYYNYSPGGSNRMYFTPENAGRIDFFRSQIENWWEQHLLTLDEYNNLLSCLIESVSNVSNTAGVYGAFLKKWDPRALKPILIDKHNSKNVPCKKLDIHNRKIEDIIDSVDCDILYLDPPYTQNQYGTQYHLLETLVLNDNPTISKITGSRSTAPMRSDWSKEYKVNILFDKIIAKTKAKHILVSYNSDGFMSKDFIEACLKRYGVIDSFSCIKIPYKKYRNWKTTRDNEHFEYLFYIKKKHSSEVVFECPLNYIGSKAKMVNEIRKHAPSQAAKAIDVFGGGFNVGINLPYSKIVYNDLNYFVTRLVKSFKEYDTYDYLMYIRKQVKKYGLERGNASAYVAARKDYNALPIDKRDSRFLFTLVLHGFQQQIRFNSDHEFNNPIGNRWFNDKVLEKMISFSRQIKECDCEFLSLNFTELDEIIGTNTFVYCDPPYRLTCGVYNDGKRGFEGWTTEHEAELFRFLDELDSRGILFMLSYVLENGGLVNGQIHDWLKKHENYVIIEISTGQGRYGVRKEVLIVNDGQAAFCY